MIIGPNAWPALSPAPLWSTGPHHPRPVRSTLVIDLDHTPKGKLGLEPSCAAHDRAPAPSLRSPAFARARARTLALTLEQVGHENVSDVCGDDLCLRGDLQAEHPARGLFEDRGLLVVASEHLDAFVPGRACDFVLRGAASGRRGHKSSTQGVARETLWIESDLRGPPLAEPGGIDLYYSANLGWYQ